MTELVPKTIPTSPVHTSPFIEATALPPWTTGTTLHAIFDEQVQRNAASLAVADAERQLTYGELAAWADSIAHVLLESGFREGSVGALLLERDISAVAAMLAVLKAGGAFMPIAAGTPPARVQALLEASHAQVLLTTAALIRDSEIVPPCRVQIIPKEPDGVRREPVVRGGPGDLAYILFTSGSTGVPKGSMIEHRNVISLVHGLHHAILASHGPRLRFAEVAPFAFDPSMQQIFSALLLGHSIHIVPEEARRDGRLLAAFLREHRIDICDGTPAHLKLLANVPASAGDKLPVRQFIIGGDTLRYADVAAFLRRYPGGSARITNIYGVAECAVDSCSYTIGDESLTATGNVPIGTPLLHARLAIRDRDLAPVAEGEAGELCIAGDGIGRGYLGDPKLTASRFVRDPLGSDRMYRTGDLARLRPDGTLEHLGRIDDQIKVRGHRVEPSEIETEILSWRNGGAPAEVVTCRRCLVTSTMPDVSFDEQGVCSICTNFERRRQDVMRYFGTLEDFDALIATARARKSGPYDCLLLYSGGKDSTYVLYRLIERGLKVMTFTFDNGFISRAALDNIARITTTLGIDHITMDAARMREIFAESLRTESTVCSGCFRALTSLSTRLAAQHGINVVITGLSRGQMMDTKLKQFLDANVSDPAEIETGLQLHRKMYHARRDNIAALLQVDVAEEIVDGIFFVDYFRYDDVSAIGVMKYLSDADQRWREPKDTGFCSTNCLINNVGIYVHQAERGFHNYAAPLSWDVRLGSVSRDEAQQKVSEHISRDAVRPILNVLKFTPRSEHPVWDAAVVRHGQDALAAYIVGREDCDVDALTAHLRARLPGHMVPSKVIRVESLPLTTNGKLDRTALTADASQRSDEPRTEVPETDTERRLVEIWKRVFERDDVHVTDHFINLGGSSLRAAMMAMLIEDEFGLKFPLAAAFNHPRLRDLAREIDSVATGEGEDRRGIIELRPSDPRCELLLVHDASGRVEAMTTLARELPSKVHVLGIEASPAVDGIRSIAELAKERLERAREVHTGDAWRIGGWSFGGLLAFEMARQLQAAGERVDALFLLDTEAPAPLHWQELLHAFIADMRKAFPPASAAVPATESNGRQCRLLLERMTRFPRGVAWLRQNAPAEIAGAVTVQGTDDDGFVAEVMTISAIVGALADYDPPPLAVETWVASASEESAGATAGHWRPFLQGQVHERSVTGTHRSILTAPAVLELSRWLAGGFALE